MGEEKTGLIKAERIIQLDRLRMELEVKGDEKPETTRNFNVPAYNRNHSIISLWKERGKAGFRLPGSAGRDRGANRV